MLPEKRFAAVKGMGNMSRFGYITTLDMLSDTHDVQHMKRYLSSALSIYGKQKTMTTHMHMLEAVSLTTSLNLYLHSNIGDFST